MWAVGAVALASALIGTMGTAAALGPDSLTAVTIASWRALIGATGMVLVATLIGQAPWKYPLPPIWLALGAVGVAGSQISYFEAVTRTGVAVGTLVAIGMGPVAAGVIDWVAYRHEPTRPWILGVSVALAGVVLLSQGALEVVMTVLDEPVTVGLVAGICLVIAGVGIPSLNPTTRSDAGATAG